MRFSKCRCSKFRNTQTFSQIPISTSENSSYADRLSIPRHKSTADVQKASTNASYNTQAMMVA